MTDLPSRHPDPGDVVARHALDVLRRVPLRGLPPGAHQAHGALAFRQHQDRPDPKDHPMTETLTYATYCPDWGEGAA